MTNDLIFESSTGVPSDLPVNSIHLSSSVSRDELFTMNFRKVSASISSKRPHKVRETRLLTLGNRPCQDPSKDRERKVGEKGGMENR